MSMRSISLYVEPKTIKKLRLALTLYPQYKVDSDTGIKTVITTDHLADQLVNEAIDTRFPLVNELARQLAKTEREFIATNKGRTNNEKTITDNTTT